MTVWPTTLPLPYVDFDGHPMQATLSSPVKNAKIQRRSRFYTAVTDVSVKWVLGIAENEEFEAFFEESLDNGAALFSIDLKYPKLTELTNWIVRIKEGYSAEYQDGNWIIEAGMELIRRGVLSAPASIEGYTYFLVLDEDSGLEHVQFVDADELNFAVRP